VYQRDKDLCIRKVAALGRVMSRKENMLREFNNYEYQG
jgi:hypothetical protein